MHTIERPFFLDEPASTPVPPTPTHNPEGPMTTPATPTMLATPATPAAPHLLPTVPPGVPLTQDEWDAMPPDERAQALAFLAAETQETMRDITPEFPKITTPTGGMLAWTLPSGDAVKEFEGVVIWHSKARAYWPLDAPVSNNPPACASFDGRYPASGHGPTGAIQCAACPLGQFGTGREGRGQACKERMLVFTMLEGQTIPTLLSLPPTGIKPFGRYIVSLLNQKPPKPLVGLTTIFGLEKKQGQGPAYSVVAARAGRPLAWTEIKAAVALREQFKDHMSRRGLTEAEVVEPDGGDGNGGGAPIDADRL